MKLAFEFAGWFQCRMATDPDPTDERRGVSGTAFALVTEPDLDRTIRFNQPVAPRSHGPAIGVRVSRVLMDDDPQPGHPMEGADVSLSDGAEFVEQNGAVVPANTAFIDPFGLRIESADGRVITRPALWDPADPSLSYYDVPAEALRRRQVRSLDIGIDEVKSASGVGEPEAFVAQRIQLLRTELEVTTGDPVKGAGLRQRLDALERTDWQRDRLYLLLGSRATYEFDLNGPAVIDGIAMERGRVDVTSPWTIRFWMGAWDNDALSGYVKGALLVPVAL